MRTIGAELYLYENSKFRHELRLIEVNDLTRVSDHIAI